MRIPIKLGVAFLLLFALAGCTAVGKHIAPWPSTIYKTDIYGSKYNTKLHRMYGTDMYLQLEDNKKSACLVIQGYSGAIFIGGTDKTLLPEWNSLFDEFLAWQPSPGEVVDKFLVIDKNAHVFATDPSLKFMVLDGKKQLVIMTDELIFPSDIFAFDEKQVKQLKSLYQQLNNTLI